MEVKKYVQEKPDKFSLYLVDFAKHLHETADYFFHFKVKDSDTLQQFSDTIKNMNPLPMIKFMKSLKI